MPRGQQKVILSREDLPAVSKLSDGSYGYIMRYRIISEDQNRYSHWSPVREMQVPIPGQVGGEIASVGDIAQVVWGDEEDRPSYDVFVSLDGGDYFYHGTTPTHQYSFLIEPGAITLRVAVQIESTNKERSDYITIFESEEFNISGLLILDPVDVLGVLNVSNGVAQLAWGNENQSPKYDIFIDEKLNVTEKSLVSNRATLSVLGEHGFSVGSIVEVSGDISDNLTLDESFSPGLIDSSVFSAKELSNGQIIIGGFFDTVEGAPIPHLARLNSDGSLDTSFDLGLNDYVYKIVVQPDGKILIIGQFTTVGGVPRYKIARLNSDGSLDTSFDANVDPDHLGAGTSTIYDVVLQPDGKIIIGGNIDTVGGIARRDAARLNSDGSVDTSFEVTYREGVYRMALQPDGKIVVGSFGGALDKNVYRLNSDGSVDNSFNANVSTDGNISSNVRALSIQTDGKILIGGSFDSVGGVTRGGFARLNSDGSLDASFDVIVNNDVKAIGVQPDEKVILGGSFNEISGVSTGKIARLNSDGSLDTSFIPNVSGGVDAIDIQTGGEILFAGSFTFVDGVRINRVGKLFFDETAFNGSHEIVEVPSTSSFSYNLSGSDVTLTSTEAFASGYYYAGSSFTHQFLSAIDANAISVRGRVQVESIENELSEGLTIFESEPVDLL